MYTVDTNDLLGEKRDFLVRKQHENHLETPRHHHISHWFRLGKFEDSLWFPPKENAKRFGFRDSLAWKLGGNLGFPTWIPGGNYMRTLGFQREACGKPQ